MIGITICLHHNCCVATHDRRALIIAWIPFSVKRTGLGVHFKKARHGRYSAHHKEMKMR
jgi:hypothetical protein